MSVAPFLTPLLLLLGTAVAPIVHDPVPTTRVQRTQDIGHRTWVPGVHQQGRRTRRPYTYTLGRRMRRPYTYSLSHPTPNTQSPPPILPIAIEKRLATALGLSIGDTISLGSTPDVVARRAVITAIHEPRPDPATVLRGDYRLRLHLPDLAALLGAPDRVDRFGLALHPGADPAALSTRLNQGAVGFRAEPSARIAAESSRTFAVVSRFHRAIGVISIVASAVFLLCIMLLKVEARRKDTAVMRLIGIRRRTIVGALVLESSIVSVVGSAMGVGLAWLAGTVTNLYYQRLFDTPLVFSLLTPGIIGFGVFLSVMLGIGAGAVAAARLSAVHPLVLWRRG